MMIHGDKDTVRLEIMIMILIINTYKYCKSL
jgi:hypothetical protein